MTRELGNECLLVEHMGKDFQGHDNVKTFASELHLHEISCPKIHLGISSLGPFKHFIREIGRHHGTEPLEVRTKPAGAAPGLKYVEVSLAQSAQPVCNDLRLVQAYPVERPLRFADGTVPGVPELCLERNVGKRAHNPINSACLS